MEDQQPKIFNDPVHGTMTLGPKLVKVINTPQFQRLRNIKQLGAVYHVYPGATHSRFEHSLGTAHLAGRFIRILRANQPELQISDDDVLCVEMAGLCHDLGHGPYSHMFDQLFLPALGVEWQHEEGSCRMFSYLLEENNIRLSETNHSEMVGIIKLMIQPPKGLRTISPAKRFLYELISNERNKMDVDKWDYLARDCHHLGIRNSFDHERFMKLCRVIKLRNGVTTICAHKKQCRDLYEMFHVRARLHRHACKHRVVISVDLMLFDAMRKANDHIRIGNFKMSEVFGNMKEYTDFDDNIIDRIMQCTADELQESRNILMRVRSRRFYKFVGSRKLDFEQYGKLHAHYRNNIDIRIAEEIFHKMVVVIAEETPREMDIPEDCIAENNFVVHVAKFDYGMKKENPCDNVYFYDKKKPNVAIKVNKHDVSEMLPEVFWECEIRVFWRHERVFRAVETAFSSWENDFLRPVLDSSPRHE